MWMQASSLALTQEQTCHAFSSPTSFLSSENPSLQKAMPPMHGNALEQC
jgi:hypothetical protein